jgi:CDP-glucose 4,6-dehydratase
MEMLGVAELAAAYRGRRVLVTGHTGFKGSWLVLWLTELGARVTGVSLAPPSEPNHWDLLGLRIADHRLDIRNASDVRRIVEDARPDCVFHLAAQSLVRRSYVDPSGTWSTNVMGTVNVLEACRSVADVRGIVVVTTDKCYENDYRITPYLENDRLGGHDPYSASKAAAELVAASYRLAFLSVPQSPLLATARAGNVIGGGDWSEDRLIPDLVRAQASRASLAVRSPSATRPWQHVLDCLAGYLLLGANLLEGRSEFACAWNFGPDNDTRTVTEVLVGLEAHWPGLRWHASDANTVHEATALSLDSTRAQTLLGWRPEWPLNEALAKTASWYQQFLTNGVVTSRRQLNEYIATASHAVPRLSNA